MGFLSKLFGKKKQAATPEQAPSSPAPAPAPAAAPAAPAPAAAPVDRAPPAAPVHHEPAHAPPPPAAPAKALAPAPPPAAAPAEAAEGAPKKAAAVPWMTAEQYSAKQPGPGGTGAGAAPATVVVGKVEVNQESEFFQGFVKFTVHVNNKMNVPASRTQVVLDFNEDILRLQRIEPHNFRSTGSRVLIGDIKAGDSKQLTYYLDPQICTETLVDGVVQYRTPDGKPQAITMKPLKAEVVCPLFFTKEVASSALLKRLVETELKVRDSKVYKPKLDMGVRHEKVYDIAKSAVSAHDVKEVREFKGYNPFHAECWFYGETKVKGYKIVIRAAVREQDNFVEFFAASTEAKAVTGLLAELNRQLTEDLESKLPGAHVDQVLDEQFKQKVQAAAQIARLAKEDVEAGETDI